MSFTLKTISFSWDAPCKNVSSATQSDQGLRCPQTESLDTTECMNGGKMP